MYLRAVCPRIALLLAALLVPTSLMVPTSLARAQGDDAELAAARALFDEGIAAAREERWEAARSAFERSYAIAERPTTLLNLAGAQVQTGRLVEATESYRRFLAEENAGPRQARYRRDAQQALADTERRLARLTIQVEGAREGDRVTLDARELPAEALGTELPVDPGSRTVALERGGATAAREVVTLAEGERRELSLRPSVDLRVSADPALPPSGPAPAGGDDTGLFVGLGVGAAAVVIAVAVIVAVVLVDGSQSLYSGSLGAGMLQFD